MVYMIECAWETEKSLFRMKIFKTTIKIAPVQNH